MKHACTYREPEAHNTKTIGLYTYIQNQEHNGILLIMLNIHSDTSFNIFQISSLNIYVVGTVYGLVYYHLLSHPKGPIFHPW